MNKSDKIIVAAVVSGMDIAVREKATVTRNDITTVSIYGNVCLTIDRGNAEITIDGNTVCSRKSSRLMNSVLKPLTGNTVSNNDGHWYMKLPEQKRLSEFTKTTVTVPFSKTRLAELS